MLFFEIKHLGIPVKDIGQFPYIKATTGRREIGVGSVDEIQTIPLSMIISKFIFIKCCTAAQHQCVSQVKEYFFHDDYLK